MKRKVRIIDTIHGKILEKEIAIANKMHLDAQIRFPHLVKKDKTKYTRKVKHKNRGDE